MDLNRAKPEIFEGITPDPEPEPEEPPHEIFIPLIMKVNAPSGLFTHVSPDALASTRAGSLAHNTEVTVMAESGDWKYCRGDFWSSGKYLTRV